MNAELRTLADLCEMDRNGLQPGDPRASALAYVGVENVVSNSGDFDFQTGSRLGDGKSTTFLFDERHVLYGKLRPYLNKVALPDFAGKCSTELVPLLPREGVDRAYLAYLLRRKATVDFVMSAVTGARMPRTDMRVLMSMPAPLPSLDEQRRIVDILNRAAGIERLRAEAREKLRAFIPALFIKVFGDPVENPMGWEVKPLGEVLAGIDGGWSPKCGDGQPNGQEWGILKLSAVTGGWYDDSEAKVLKSETAPRPEIEVKPGDLLLSRKNTKDLVGACAWASTTATHRMFPDTVFRLRPDDESVSTGYLWALLNLQTMRPAIERIATGAAASMVNISKGRLRELEIPVPPLDLQQRFAEIIASTRGIVTTADTARAAAEALSGSLMARLFGEASDTGPNRTAGSQPAETVDTLIDYAQTRTEHGERVCLQPDAWITFSYKCGIPEGTGPLQPVILGGWWDTDDLMKRSRLFAQIRHAAQKPGRLAQAGQYLRSLPDDAWHHDPTLRADSSPHPATAPTTTVATDKVSPGALRSALAACAGLPWDWKLSENSIAPRELNNLFFGRDLRFLDALPNDRAVAIAEQLADLSTAETVSFRSAIRWCIYALWKREGAEGVSIIIRLFGTPVGDIYIQMCEEIQEMGGFGDADARPDSYYLLQPIGEAAEYPDYLFWVRFVRAEIEKMSDRKRQQLADHLKGGSRHDFGKQTSRGPFEDAHRYNLIELGYDPGRIGQ